MTCDVVIRAFQPGDAEGVLANWNRVFPTADGRIRPRGMDHWRWKFLANPLHRQDIVIAEHAEAGIVGSYPTIALPVWMDGATKVCGHVVDLVVDPAHRRAGERPGLFVQLGLSHYAHFGGIEPGRHEFHYGWPVPAWRMGQRYLHYENVRDWDFLFREAGPDGIPVRSAPAGLVVREVARFGAEVDALFERMKPQLKMAIVRDSAYLNWRYADAHDARYRLYECREAKNGSLRGICVYTVCDFLFPHTAFLVDWLLPEADGDATVAMVAAVEQQANRDGARALATLFPQLDPRFLRFQRMGFLVLGTSYFVVMARHSTRETTWYRENWYHTAGDSDLV